MKRMYDDRVAKLIEKVNQNGNITEVGGNLEVDGTIQLNGGFKPIHTYVDSEDPESKFEIYTENIMDDGRIVGICSFELYFGIYCNDSPDVILITYFSDDYELYRSTISLSENTYSKTEEQSITINSGNYQREEFRHTIEIKGTNISLCFSTETTDNNPIDSLQDLIAQLASTKVSCSGYIGTDIVSKINIGATATAITFETSGGQKTIASLGTITIEDDVTTI